MIRTVIILLTLCHMVHTFDAQYKDIDRQEFVVGLITNREFSTKTFPQSYTPFSLQLRSINYISNLYSAYVSPTKQPTLSYSPTRVFSSKFVSSSQGSQTYTSKFIETSNPKYSQGYASLVVEGSGSFGMMSLSRFFPAPALTAQPTNQPSLQPSNQPSTEPTNQPSLQPSNQPSSEPTIQPSNQPSLQPTDFPTAEPTSQPSRSPSVYPSTQPSLQPTVAPTSQPSRQPSRQPTRQPTRQPSTQPSAQPSSSPSSVPTNQPISAPLSSPTLRPTRIMTSQPSQISNYQNITQDLQTVTLMTESLLAKFFVNTSYIDSRNIGANDTKWNSIVVKLRNLDVRNVPREIFVVSVGATPCTNCQLGRLLDETVESCSEPASLATLWQALIYSQEANVYCKGTNWLVSVCGGVQSRLCAGCVDPCGVPSLKNRALPVLHDSSIDVGVFSIGFGVSVIAKLPLYPTWTQRCSAGSTNVTISYEVSAPGLLTCNAFLPTVSVDSPLMIGVGNSVGAVVDTTRTGTLIISQLLTATSYNIMCYTQSFQNTPGSLYISPISMTVAMSCSISTRQAPTAILISASFSSLQQLSTSSGISLSLTQLPTTNVTIVPRIYYLGPKNCSNYGSPVSSDSSEVGVAPSAFFFAKSKSNLNGVFYIEPLLVGCLAVTVDLFGPGKNEYFVNNKLPLISIYPPEAMANDLTVISIAFYDTGAKLILSFSDATDMGATFGLDSSAWACSLLLQFSAASQSTCQFSSPNTIVIIPPSSAKSGLPVIGDIVTLIGGRVRKPCLPIFLSKTVVGCNTYAYMTSVFVPITTLVTIIPRVVFNAPSSMQSNTSVVIDISSSTGNGNRPWTSVMWSVTGQSPGLQDFMNGGTLAWYGCVPGELSCNRISADWFLVPGVYVFSLVLTNFFGEQGMASQAIEVAAAAVILPQVCILGPDLYYLSANASLVLMASLGSNEAPTNALKFGWTVYRNNMVDSSVVSAGHVDNTQFSILKYSLLVGQQYLFRVTVSSLSGGYSSSDVTIVVLPGQIIPVLHGASDMTLCVVSDSLLLDASGSFDTATSSSANLQYQWTCVQLEPFNSTGCLNFYSYLDSQLLDSAAVVSIADISKILNYPAQYSFTVQVLSSTSIDTAQIASKTVRTYYDASLTVQPIIDIVQIKGKFDFTNILTIGATILYSDAYLAQWSYQSTSSLNQTFMTAVEFVNTNGYSPFPLFLESSALTFGQSYQFQLSVVPVNCGDASCPISFGSITVQLNQAPQFGTLSSSPVSGTTSTQFTLYASNWQDIDLPITYAFYQVNHVTGSLTLIRRSSQLTYMTSTLAAGDPAQFNFSTITAVVADSYNFQTTASIQLQISNIIITPAQLMSSTSSSITMAINQNNADIVISAVNVFVHSASHMQCLSGNSSTWSTCNDLVSVGVNAVQSITQLADPDMNIVLMVSQSLSSLASSAAFSTNSQAVEASAVLLGYISQATVGQGLITGGSSPALLMDSFMSIYGIVAKSSFGSAPNGRRLLNSSLISTETLDQGLQNMTQSAYSALYSGQSYNYTGKTGVNLYMSKNRILNSAAIDWELPSFVVMSNQSFDRSVTGAAIGNLVVRSDIGNPTIACSSGDFDVLNNLKCNAETILVELHLYANAATPTVLLSSSLTSNTAIAPNVSTTRHTTHRNCTGFTNSTISSSCSPVQTMGLSYAFPNISCQVGEVEDIYYTCPVYAQRPFCWNDNNRSSSCMAVTSAAGLVTCNCAAVFSATQAMSLSTPVHFMLTAFVSSGSSLQQSSPPVVTLTQRDLTHPTTAPTIAPVSVAAVVAKKVNVTAIAAIIACAVFFSIFVYKKLRKVQESPLLILPTSFGAETPPIPTICTISNPVALSTLSDSHAICMTAEVCLDIDFEDSQTDSGSGGSTNSSGISREMTAPMLHVTTAVLVQEEEESKDCENTNNTQQLTAINSISSNSSHSPPS